MTQGVAKQIDFPIKGNIMPPLTVDEWRQRNIPQQDFLLGALYSTTTRATLVAPTGLGKTNFAIAKAAGMATGKGFLHFDGRRQAKVLVIDGELPSEWAQKLIADMEERLGDDTALLVDTFHYLNTEDVETFHPLNTQEGQEYINSVINRIGGVDFIIFDNIMSLISGSMKEEEAWSETLPWIKSLTKRRIGQLWIHHTGINESRGYGTDTKNWQFDTVMLMERNQGSQADISFNLKFQKCRRRTPSTRQYYEETTIELRDNEWTRTTAPETAKKLTNRDQRAYQVLLNVICEKGEKVIPKRDMSPRHVVNLSQWREELKRASVTSNDKPNSERSQWKAIHESLAIKGVIGIYDNKVWCVRDDVTKRDESVTVTVDQRDVT
jgi:hypothetical protein